MSACDAAMRPFPNDTEVRCELDLDGEVPHLTHESVLRDYAYPGSATKMSWQEHDRRNFHGPWPGPCEALKGCILPNRHGGNCAT